MVFSSVLFLFLFLPIALALYFLVPRVLRNAVLLLTSLIFYLWGEGPFVFLMLASITLNYVGGLLVHHWRHRKLALGLTVAANLGLLIWFKYANFLDDNLNSIGLGLSLDPVHLPIGISFFTFQAISYVVDVYRGDAPAQEKPQDLALFISLFPQLIAGPIVRYRDVAEQITQRVIDRPLFASGVRRFIVGLAKKVLIANVLGQAADEIFALDYQNMDMTTAWLGILCYTFQIYFDFSGYSDMAIGLGRMFGFRFLENFNYPYIAASIQDFWRRWHISLSSWFRDYLYIPLGGSRVGNARLYFNLVTVFFLCGLWHGASWNFVIWGLIHGLFLVFERLGLGELLKKTWRPLRHVYVLLVVIMGWVFFRIEALDQALIYLSAMLNPAHTSDPAATYFVSRELVMTLVLATLGSAPILRDFFEQEEASPRATNFFGLLRSLLLLAFLIICAAYLASGTYNPFIYFRF